MRRRIKILGLEIPLWALAGVYALLAAGSWYAEHRADARPIGRPLDEPDAWVDTTGLPVRQNPLPYNVDVYTPDDPEPGALPVLLLHGTPGGASNFALLGPAIAERGRTAIAVDLPGFGSQREPGTLFGGRGRVFDSYSEHFYAELMIRLLDELGIERVHVVGWSNGGAAAMWMAHLLQEDDPDRVASLTLMASVGEQSTEGSGSYSFEHAKYAVGYAGLVWAAELVPTYGVLGSPSERRAFLRNFWDTDQRPLADVMRTIETPTLILHGRHDFLTPDWGAEAHHALMPSSRLVMTPYDHFMPFTHADVAAGYITEHAARHDQPGVPALTGAEYLGEPRTPGLFADVRLWFTQQHFSVGLLLIAVLALCGRTPAIAVGALLVATQSMDLGAAVAGLTLGVCVRRSWKLWFYVFLRAFVALGLLWIPVEIAETRANGFSTAQAVGVLLGVALVYAVIWPLLTHVWTWRGRRRLLAKLRAMRYHEFWPARFFYGPLLFWLAWLTVRHRGALTFACANPGIERGGGLVAESKDEILRAMHDPRVLEHAAVPPGPADERLRTFEDSLHRLGGYPVILKPDMGERGLAVRLVRDRSLAQEVLARTRTTLIAQKFHPGPSELGVFWVRTPGTDTGRVFSATHKVFPEVTGDGRRTLERLVLDHPRYRVMERVFRARFGAQWRSVPGAGERIRLSQAGNHAQGTEFRDGGHLVTPELEKALNEIALGFRDERGGGFDIGRFDLRYENEDDLKAGRFAVIELNGTSSESTNIYDPGRAYSWALGVMLRQWSCAYELGAWRRSTGVRPPNLLDLWRWIRENRRGHASGGVAD